MALLDSTPIRRAIPHEPGEWLEIRRLPWSTLREARKELAASQREEMKALGAEFISAISTGRDQDEQRIRAKLAARQWDFDQFEQRVLLTKGIVGWSYAPPVDADAIDTLDAQTAEWAANEILSVSKPKTEEETKNAFASSIGS